MADVDTFIKSSFGWLEMVNYSANPTDGDSTRKGLAVVSGVLKLWTGTTWTAVSSGSGGFTTWDELYDVDKTLSIDDATLTFALTHLTNDGLTITGGASVAGSCLQITNAGSGKDINGTSDTWSFTKAGILDCTGITIGDDESVTFGDDADATIQYDENGNNVLQFTCTGGFDFDNAVGMDGTLAVGGDVTFSDSSLTITDADNAATVTVINATLTDGANLFTITADAITDKSILYIDNGGASLTSGYYINCNDDGTSDFTVGADGATVITTASNATKALVITGIQTSEYMVTLDNTGGVIASDKAILLLDAGGNVADGGNMLRLAPTGTPVEGSIGIEFVGAGKLMQAIYADSDSVDHSVVHLHGGGALASGMGVLEVTNDGNLASGGTLASFTLGGTPNAGAIAIDIDAQKNCTALKIDSDSATNDAVVITGAGALGAGKAMLAVTNAGTITDGSYLVDITSGANAASSTTTYALHIDATHDNIEGLHVDSGKVVIDEGLGLGNWTVEARTVTADGSTTGTISDDVNFVVVTSDDANKILILPAPTPGKIVWIKAHATVACELRTSDPETIELNNVSGAGKELVVAADTSLMCVCLSATQWIAMAWSNVGAPTGGGTPD